MIIKIGNSDKNNKLLVLEDPSIDFTNLNIETLNDDQNLPDTFLYQIKYITQNKIELKVIRTDQDNGWCQDLKVILKDFKRIIAIPKTIYYTCKDKDNIPKQISDIIKHNQDLNPEYESIIYGDNECRLFIIKYFSILELYCFDKLIPGAFKADLFRLCILYIYGGTYMDIGLKLELSLDSIIENYSSIMINERDNSNTYHNAFMISYPKNIFFIKGIKDIVNTVLNLEYYNDSLAIGAKCLKKYIKYNNNLGKILQFEGCGHFTSYNQKKVIHHLKDYLRDKYDIKHGLYHNLWSRRAIYNKSVRYIKISENQKKYDIGDSDTNIIYLYINKDDILTHNKLVKRLVLDTHCDVFSDEFSTDYSMNNQILTIKRIDKNEGWGQNLELLLID